VAFIEQLEELEHKQHSNRNGTVPHPSTLG